MRLRANSCPPLSNPAPLHQQSPATQAAKPVAPDLTEGERTALSNYTQVSAKINRQLRSGKLDEPVERAVHSIRSGIEKSVAMGRSTEWLLKRGIASVNGNAPINWFKEGKTFKDDGFQSMTTDSEVAKTFARLGTEPDQGVVMHMFNGKAASLADLAAHPGQKEFLAKDGTESKVLFTGYDEKENLHKVVLEGIPGVRIKRQGAQAHPEVGAAATEIKAFLEKGAGGKTLLHQQSEQKSVAFLHSLQQLSKSSASDVIKASLLFEEKDEAGNTVLLNTLEVQNEAHMDAVFQCLNWLSPEARVKVYGQPMDDQPSILEIAVEMGDESLLARLFAHIDQLSPENKAAVVESVKDDPLIQKRLHASDATAE